ncbi:MAG: trypsin-like peptidase domain-containing protein [Candidatus Poribacteria bacterium]
MKRWVLSRGISNMTLRVLRNSISYLTGLLLLIILSIGMAGCGADNPASPPEDVTSKLEMVPGLQVMGMPTTVAEDVQANFVQVATAVQPSVVFISVKKRVVYSGFFGPFNDVVRGYASGIIIRSDGYILTNEHVVKDMDEVKVTLSTGTELYAEVIGTDPLTDLAVIKVEPPATEILKPAELGDSDSIDVGEWAMAIGSSLGLEETVTIGVISAVHRDVIPPESPQGYRDFIQTDASINPGNSGGPLVNIKSEVIGVNTFIATTSGGSIGIGFAVPINTAKYVIEQLIDSGKVVRGWLGIGVQELSPRIAAKFEAAPRQGVLIGNVVPDSPADEAGLKVGDIIEEVDEHGVKSVLDLQNAVAKAPVGEHLRVVINRDGEELEINVIVGERPQENNGKALNPPVHFGLGLTVQNITWRIAQQLGLQNTDGVVVTKVEPGSSADDEGIKVGDVVREVNRVKIENLDDYNREIGKVAEGEDILLLIQRGDNTHYVVLANGEKVEKAPGKPLIYL